MNSKSLTLNLTLTDVEYVLYIKQDDSVSADDWEDEQDIAAFHEHGAVGYILKVFGDTASGNRIEIELDSCWGFINMPNVVEDMRDHFDPARGQRLSRIG